MSGIDLNRDAKGRSGPLCGRYLLVRFVAQPTHVRAGTATQMFSVTWALGMLSNGQREVLGVWLHTPTGALNWQVVFHGLVRRGVEQIRFLVDADADAARAAFPHAVALSPALPRLADVDISPPEMSSPPQRAATSASAAAHRMQAELARKLHRQGSFESAEAALLFVDATLQRLEARSWAQPCVGAAPAAHPRASSQRSATAVR